jgi:hypothetical protein
MRNHGAAIAVASCAAFRGARAHRRSAGTRVLIDQLIERRERPAVQAFLAALADPVVRERVSALGMTPA